MTTLLHDADPAATINPSAISVTADEMLRDVLATPRTATRASARRRLLLGGALSGAAATVAVAVPLFWGSDGGPGAPAYAVERHADGSVDVSIDFAQFHDPAGLQRSLDAQGIPAVVLAGRARALQVGPDGSIQGDPSLPPCARYVSGLDSDASPSDPNQPVYYNADPRFDQAEIHLRPELLPANGSYVIDIYTSGSRVTELSGDVALGTPPTCI